MSGATALSTATNRGTSSWTCNAPAVAVPTLGALLEWPGAKLLAVDASDGELAQTIADYVQAREGARRYRDQIQEP